MKKILLLVICVVFLASTCCISSAAVLENNSALPTTKVVTEENVAQPYSGSCTYSFTKTSSTSARAQAMAGRPGASSITSTIQLQKKSGSSYVNTSSKSTKTVQATTINHITNFTISSSYTYRIKIGIKYTKNGVTTTDYYYKVL